MRRLLARHLELQGADTGQVAGQRMASPRIGALHEVGGAYTTGVLTEVGEIPLGLTRVADLPTGRVTRGRRRPRHARAGRLAATSASRPSRHFNVDRHPEHPQVTIASPCSGHGLKFASVIGEILADLAVDGRTRHDISLFRLGRLAPA